MLGRHRSAITGLVALDIARLTSSSFITDPIATLDIVCPVGGYPADNFVRHLEENEKCTVLLVHNHDPARTEAEESGELLVVQLVRPNGARIRVIVSASASVTFVIPFMSGTHLMNIVTGNAIIITYPELTLAGHACINPMRNTPEVLMARCATLPVKPHPFSENILVLSDPSQTSYYCPHRPRMLGDPGSFVIVYSDNDPAPALRRSYRAAHWVLGGDQCGCCDQSSPSTVTVRVLHVAPYHVQNPLLVKTLKLRHI